MRAEAQGSKPGKPEPGTYAHFSDIMYQRTSGKEVDFCGPRIGKLGFRGHSSLQRYDRNRVKADVRNRTGNRRFTKPVLYQLSYVGVGSHRSAGRPGWGLTGAELNCNGAGGAGYRNVWM